MVTADVSIQDNESRNVSAVVEVIGKHAQGCRVYIWSHEKTIQGKGQGQMVIGYKNANPTPKPELPLTDIESTSSVQGGILHRRYLHDLLCPTQLVTRLRY